MPDIVIPLRERGLAIELAELVREARLLLGLTQRGLAASAGTSQTMISRIENARSDALDLIVVERLLRAIGATMSLGVSARHLEDRRRQRDAVHARLNGYVARNLERDGWQPATEVWIGDAAPRGWIDLLAYREADRSLLVEETKTDIPDMGALQRSVAFYEREAAGVARRLGWRPKRVVVFVVALDSEVIHRRIAENRDLVTRAFPSPVDVTAAWLADPSRPVPRGWTLGTADPASRRAAWLRPTLLGNRRARPAYTSYADAAAHLHSGR